MGKMQAQELQAEENTWWRSKKFERLAEGAAYTLGKTWKKWSAERAGEIPFTTLPYMNAGTDIAGIQHENIILAQVLTYF